MKWLTRLWTSVVRLFRRDRRLPAPEIIRTKEPQRGACGVRGCLNMRPHSHVMDLARKLDSK